MHDLIVVGGGPAGLAAAIEAARRGLSCVVLEPRQGVIDKACGEGLMPAGVAALAALGVELPGGRPFAGIHYRNGREPAAWAEGTLPGGPGLGVRRAQLHGALLARATSLGVEVRPHRARDVRQRGDRVVADGLEARWLVAADGLASPIRRAMALELPPRGPARYGARRHFRVRPWTDRVEVWFGTAVEAYVTPVGPDEVGVAVLFEAPGRYDALLAALPALRERLGEPTTAVRGAGPFERRVRRRVAGRVLLVGDAAGYVDPLTGEGVALALESGVAAVRAIAAGRPEAYEGAWRRLAWRPFALTAALLRLTRSPLRRALVPALRRAPWLFDAALAALAGDHRAAGSYARSRSVRA